KDEIAELRRGNSRRIRLRAASQRIRRIEALNRVLDEFVAVRFRSGNLMVPMLANREFPARVRAEEMVVRVGVQARRRQQRLSRSPRVACVVAQGNAQMIRVAER